jgi:amino acid adenylation domain-containing protein
VTDLLSALAAQGVVLWFEGNRLRFRAPQGALSAELRAQIGARRDEVLAALRAQAAQQQRSAPLSHPQQALWFVHQEQPDSAAYNVLFALRVLSPVDESALRQALQALVDRHAVLRTTCEVVDGLPRQCIAGTGTAALELHDVAGLDDATLHRLIDADARRPFDLAHGPVMRTALYRRAAGDQVLLLAVHHIAIDGWSLLMLLEEFRALLAEAGGGAPAGLARVERQYADYTEWQAAMLAGPQGAQLEAYWTRQLAAPRAEIELPPDRPRPPRRSGQGASFDFYLDAATTARLNQLARDEGMTLYVLLLAAFKVLLYRHTGCEDVIVGTPTFGRTQPEFARVLGDFVNPVALRSRVHAGLPFRTLMQQVRGTLLEALDAQEYPLSLLVERLQPVRDASRSPLFETMFVLQRFEQFRELNDLLMAGASDVPVDFAGWRVTPYALTQQEGQFDLGLGLIDRSDALSGAFKYNPALFDRATIERLWAHYRVLLDGIVADPAMPIGRLPLLDATERAALLPPVLPPAQPIAVADAQPLHRRFEAHAAATPDATALRCDGAALSYGALNRRANQVAHRLQALGVGPGTRVGLCAERSIDLVVGLLGIVKAGGAYVPVDLSYPAERVAFMLGDAQAPVMLTQSALLAQLPPHAGATLCLDDPSLADAPHENPASPVSVDDLIYVIYTSGSTGQPKGTLLTHRAVDRLFSATAAWFHFGPQDVWTLFHSVAFDFSVWELWGALAHGGCLVVVPQAVSRSPEAFLQLLHDERVTVLNQTPSAFRQLVQADVDSGVPRRTSLREVVFGGEALELQALRPWFERHGDAQPRLVNMYGITETCVHVTYRPITRADVDARAGSVIGVPIPDLRVLLLDALLQPVPIGVTGELFVGGPGLALGYLNRQELTAARFIGDPLRPGERLYRSGDLARWRQRAEGALELEYLGRIDHQVKIRGFRIELGEIEALLAQQPGVRESAVLAREDVPGDQRLVAYVAGSAEVDALKQALRERLPDYMVPAAFVVLPTLPLTGNGKVDRQALPAPAGLVATAARRVEPPQGETEQGLAAIWRDVLGLGDVGHEVGRHDNFFELGGHSLLATQVTARIRQALDRGFVLRAVFEHPVLHELARAIEAGRAPAAASAAITRLAGDGPSPLSFAQERMWLLHELAPDSSAYNMPVALRLHGVLDRAALVRALDALVQRHETLRTTFAMIDGRPMQTVQPHRAVALPFHDLRAQGRQAEEAAIALATDTARAYFDLVHGPVFRTLLIQVADDEHVLLLAMHHIAGDQWSYGVLGRELAEAYAAFSRGAAPAWPPLAVQYRDVAMWQRERFQGELLETQLGYWRRQLDGVAPLLLPTDHPRPTILSDRAAWHADVLPPALIESLEAFSRARGCTLFMTLFAAYVTLLHRYSGQADIAVAVPIANREQREVEGLVGGFINTLVLRSTCGDDTAFAELLASVRTTALEAYAHQELPFAKLVEELRPMRGPALPPLAQVLFTLQNAPMTGIEFPGLQWEPVAIDRGAAPFELGLYIEAAVSGSVLFEYSTELYDEPTIRRMAGHYRMLLESLVEAPTTMLAKLPMLTADEQRWLRVEMNGTAAAHASDVYPRLFEAQVARSPEAEAVRYEGASLTYAALNARANRVANRLRAMGVGPGQLVGVCLQRSLALVVALLGVQKAGGAYVPLDPGFPAERLAYMLEDSGARVLVAGGDAADGIALPPGVQLLDVLADAVALGAGSEDNLANAPAPDDPAYVIYTSGSTGRPKGVVVPHGALANFLHSMRREPGLAAGDVLAAVTTVSFDIAGLELYLPWLVGARVELCSRETAADGIALSAALAASGATVLQATPATWRLLLEAGWTGGPNFRALCGGEGLPRELADALLARVGELWNLYGPTETTVWSTAERVIGGGAPVTIGRPIDNTQVHVLSRAGELQPAGIPGELWIGGAGVATGYHRRPELTADRFIADRFSTQPGARLYRTGDLGRWTAQGRLEHLGRIDHQVKIRGFRIELGEIESVLAGHEAVRQSVVIAREAGPGDLRLVAYVVYQAGEDLTVSEVRRHLRRELPDYMVPSLVVALDAIPLTPNGKVDRAALPDPFRNVAPVAAYEPPAPGLERLLADVWQQTLQIERVGAEDNFFELGGHSLLSLRVVVAVEARTGWRMDPRVLFFQNLRQIAAAGAAHVSADFSDHLPSP